MSSALMKTSKRQIVQAENADQYGGNEPCHQSSHQNRHPGYQYAQQALNRPLSFPIQCVGHLYQEIRKPAGLLSYTGQLYGRLGKDGAFFQQPREFLALFETLMQPHHPRLQGTKTEQPGTHTGSLWQRYPTSGECSHRTKEAAALCLADQTEGPMGTEQIPINPRSPAGTLPRLSREHDSNQHLHDQQPTVCFESISERQNNLGGQRQRGLRLRKERLDLRQYHR